VAAGWRRPCIATSSCDSQPTDKVERWHKTVRREFLDGKAFACGTDNAC
jgi:hypothetical protein